MSRKSAALALLLAACGDASPGGGQEALEAPLGAPVLQGPAGPPAGEDALSAYATKADLDEAAAAYASKLSWGEAEGLLTQSELPTAEALDELLDEADLAALDEAITIEEADSLLVPWSLVPDPSLLMPKDEAAKTFVLAATAPDYDAWARKSDLAVWDTLLTQAEADALYPSAAAIADTHYSKVAASQTFQGAFEPLSPALRAQVEAVVDAALAQPPCADGMVAVGDVCVDRFEASVWSQPSCAGVQYGVTSDDYPPSFPDSGAFSGPPVFACSLPGVRPSAHLTWFQADQACAASGKRLCSLAEWQAAAAGTPDDPALCRIDPFAGQSAVIDAATGCVSAWGAADMVGNVAEWTATLRVVGKKWVQGSESTQTTPWPFADDATAGVNGYGAMDAQDGNFVKGSPVAVVRGGSYLDGAAAGVFAMDWTRSPADVASTLGFRCCASR